MKKNLLYILFTFLSVSLFAQNKTTIQLKPNQNSFDILSAKTDGLRFKNSISELNFIENNTKSANFVSLEAQGLFKTYGKGKPQIPVISKLIEVPFGADVKLKIISFTEEIIELEKNGIYSKLMPQQPSRYKTKDKVPFYYDENAYEINHFPENEILIYEKAGIMRNIQLGRIEIQPIQYNPKKNILKVYSDIEIEVIFTNSDVKKVADTKYNSTFFNNTVNKTSINSIKKTTKALITNSSITYVIVSDRMFENQLTDFITWKKQKGFHVITAYTDEIGKTTTEIKAFLENLYKNPEKDISPPSFCLLVGDVEQIPAWNGSSNHITDLRYFEYTGDNLPEVFHGRFSAQTTQQLQIQIDKTLLYEKYLMPDPSYLGKSILISGVDASYAPTYGNGAMRYAHQYYVNQAHDVEAYTYLYKDATNSTVMESNSSAAPSSIIEKINSGVAFANYTAHCSPTSWHEPNLSTSDVANLTNVGKYGLWIGNCCESLRFENSESFGEAVLRAENKGAIGYIGGSNETLWDEDYYWGVGLASISSNPSYEASGLGVYDALFHDKANEISNTENWYITQAQISTAGNLAVQASTSENKQYYWEIYHLMGDPSLMPYLSVPEEITAIINPTSIIIGINSFQVTTTPHAYVAFSQNGELISTGMADAEGIVEIQYSAEQITVGKANIVITAQNKQPYFAEMDILPADEPYVALNSFETTISPDYGKTISLNINLKNLADLQSVYHAESVNATLQIENEHITIIDNSEVFGLLNAGTDKTIASAFSFAIAEDIPDKNSLDFTISITAENEKYSWSSKFSIIANAPNIEIKELSILNDNNANGILDPNENGDILIEISNSGHAEAVFKGNLSLADALNTDLTLNSIIDTKTIGAGNSVQFSYNANASAEATIGTPIDLVLNVEAGANQQYSHSESKILTIGKIPIHLISNSETISTCNGLFYDSGDENANYSSNENFIKTFAPNSNSSILKINFTEFNLEESYDYLYIYNGMDINSPQIKGSPFTGVTSPGTLTSSLPFTFKFTSDQDLTEAGWKASVECIIPTEIPNCATNPVPINNESNFFPSKLEWEAENVYEFDVYIGTDSNPLNQTPVNTKFPYMEINVLPNTSYYWTVVPKNIVGSASNCEIWTFTTGDAQYIMTNGNFYNVCTGVFYDTGKAESNYASNENYTMTLFPEEELGNMLKASFKNFNIEENTTNGGCWDYLKIYDGESISDNLIGEYCGTTVPSELTEITATNDKGALTFVFHSDQNTEANGWVTDISCTNSVASIGNTENIELKLYPNPNNGNFIIEYPKFTSENIMIEVISLSGKLVYKKQISSEKEKINLNLNYLSNGIYHVRLFSEKNIFNKKIVIQK